MTFIDTLNAVIEDKGLTTYLDTEALEAYAGNFGLDAEDFEDWQDEAEEAYAGEFGDAAEFAESLATDLGMVKSDASWPNNHIDWEAAGEEIMVDYFESGGYYFRNL